MRNIVIYRSSICGTKELGEWKLLTPLKILLRQCSSRVVERHSGHSCFGLVYFDMFQIETFNHTKKFISGNLHWGWFKGTLGTVVFDWYILICFKMKLSTPLKILLWQSSLRLVKRHSGWAQLLTDVGHDRLRSNLIALPSHFSTSWLCNLSQILSFYLGTWCTFDKHNNREKTDHEKAACRGFRS